MIGREVVRWTGCALLFALCSLFGYREAWRLSERCRELDTLGQIILLMRGEVRYGNTPLPEIFAQTAERLSLAGGGSARLASAWLSWLGDRLADSAEPFETVWREGVGKFWENSCLSGEDLQLLDRLGDGLGCSDKALQLELFAYYLQQFETQERAARERSGVYGRLYRGLGILGGAFLLVLIL